MSDPPNSGRKADGTFTPGNPFSRGKAKGTRHRTTLMAERLMADEAEAVVQATIQAALKGDTAAQRIILDRIAPVRKGRAVPLPGLPEATTADGVLRALGGVVARMADGTLTPDEAATVASVVAQPRAIIEAEQFEARLAAIEEKLARGEGPPQREGDEP